MHWVHLLHSKSNVALLLCVSPLEQECADSIRARGKMHGLIWLLASVLLYKIRPVGSCFNLHTFVIYVILHPVMIRHGNTRREHGLDTMQANTPRKTDKVNGNSQTRSQEN